MKRNWDIILRISICCCGIDPSSMPENKKGSHENNERLEFLGDAVLDMVVSEYMYRKFPEMPEGELTKLRAAVVCEGSLAGLSRKLGVGRNLFLGKGEEALVAETEIPSLRMPLRPSLVQ